MKMTKSRFMIFILCMVFIFTVSIPVNAAAKEPVLNKDSLELSVNQTSSLYLKNLPAKPKLMKVKSSKSSVVKVSKKGEKAKVVGKKLGTSKVTLTYKINGKIKKYVCTVRVRGLRLNCETLTLSVNEVIKDSCYLRLIDIKQNKVKLIKAKSSNPNVVKILNGRYHRSDISQTIAAVNPGVATVTLTYKVNGKYKKYKCVVTVIKGKSFYTPDPIPENPDAPNAPVVPDVPDTPENPDIPTPEEPTVSDNDVPKEHVHDWVFYEYLKPTCSLNGRNLYVCSDRNCEELKTEIIETEPALGPEWYPLEIPGVTDTEINGYKYTIQVCLRTKCECFGPMLEDEEETNLKEEIENIYLFNLENPNTPGTIFYDGEYYNHYIMTREPVTIE